MLLPMAASLMWLQEPREKLDVRAAGRTDAGVHARGQVGVHLELVRYVQLPNIRLQYGNNDKGTESTAALPGHRGRQPAAAADGCLQVTAMCSV
jgi:hypothetical protein